MIAFKLWLSRLLTDCPKQLVLDYFKKLKGLFIFRIVVNTCRVDVSYLLIKKALLQPDFPDQLLKFGEIIHRITGFKSVVIQGKTFDNVFL